MAAAGDVDGDGWDDLVLGAPFHDAGATDAGAAFVFRGGPNGVSAGSVAAADWVLASDQPGSNFGYDVDGAGDVDGDGYADVIVGGIFHDGGETDEGVALLFAGGPSGIASGGPDQASTRLEVDEAGALFGISVRSAGDVDADGVADAIVGAFQYGEPDAGAAFVYLPEPGLPAASAGVLLASALGAARTRGRSGGRTP